MTSPKITEGVKSVMTNPQNQAENGCNRCNDYITSITPNKSAPHNKDEVNALYLKFRASGVDPTANILHRAIGDGSLSTLQRFVKSIQRSLCKN